VDPSRSTGSRCRWSAQAKHDSSQPRSRNTQPIAHAPIGR
jgi:hypothetical protein